MANISDNIEHSGVFLKLSEPPFRLLYCEDSPWFYRFVRPLTWFWLRLYNSFRVEGLENVPKKPPYLTVANHGSIFDGMILSTALPHPVSFMVKKEAFQNPVINWILRNLQTFPVDRDNPGPGVVKTCLKILSEGKVLGIFPEGTRNFKGLVRPFKHGAIKFAIRQKTPILPAYIANSHLMNPQGSILSRPVQIIVGFAEPIDVAAMLKAGKSEQEIQDLTYQRVCETGARLRGCDVRDFTV